jgi:MFS family permease
MAATVLAFLGFAAEPGLVGWMALALLLGLGTAAANTVSNLFVVEAHPKPEWDERIGWLQAFSNAGSVGGLLLASALAHVALRGNFLIGAALTAIAAALAWATTRTPPRPATPKPPGVGAGPEPEWSTNTPQRNAHYVTTRTLKRLGALARSRYGVFVLAWLVANLGLAAVNALYPLMMRGLFDVQPRASSALMSVATGASILLYAPSSMLVKKLGEPRVFQVAMLGRAAALLALTLIGFASFGGREWPAALAWFAVVLAGPLFSVSGTVMASTLAAGDEGEAIGQYNAAGSLGALVGSATGGWAAARWGYDAVPAIGLAGVGAGLVLSLLLPRVTPTQATRAAPHGQRSTPQV